MFDSPGKPVYPPARNTWEFPPPEVGSRWKWLAIVVSITGLLVGAALATVIAVFGTRDFPSLIENEKLTDTIATECTLMRETVESLPLSGSNERQARTITDQNKAVELMVQSIRSARPEQIRDDKPAEQWLRDWGRLVEARDTFARELRRDPNAELVVPVDDDGVEITTRMDNVWFDDSVCQVPETLAFPYTDDFADA